jgi:hypothetical protein
MAFNSSIPLPFAKQPLFSHPTIASPHVYAYRWMRKIIVCLDLRQLDDHDSYEQDPLKVYITRKLKSHGGFLVESVVEAVPQSILQYDMHTPRTICQPDAFARE